ncbi:MAG TPA: hypothetical protein VMW36_05045 [Patescibacteria group bacterium]|nr:hypothetical protein [Patescibacteria group bacterium]
MLGSEVGVIKEVFVWSDLDSPTELMDKWLLAFESATKTIRVNMTGPINNEWTLKFTDLKKPLGREGNFEQYYYRLQTHCEGRLWELYTYGSPPLERTIGPLVKFVPKLGYAIFPSNFVKNLLQSYGPNQELTAFKAGRDYFVIEVGNPSEHIRKNFANMAYRSSNVQEDFVTLVEKKPVGPLLLTSTDFKITYHSSKVRTCKIRIDIRGKLDQIGKGDTDIFREVRGKVLKFLENQIEKTMLSTPTSRIEVKKDAKSQTEIISREITQLPKLIVIKLNKQIDVGTQKRIVGLFTQNILDSGFFGTIEWKSDAESVVRTTDAQGGGDAILSIQIGKDFLLISPLSTTTARTIDRIYHMILEKVDVDSILTHTVE